MPYVPPQINKTAGRPHQEYSGSRLKCAKNLHFRKITSPRNTPNTSAGAENSASKIQAKTHRSKNGTYRPETSDVEGYGEGPPIANYTTQDTRQQSETGAKLGLKRYIKRFGPGNCIIDEWSIGALRDLRKRKIHIAAVHEMHTPRNLDYAKMGTGLLHEMRNAQIQDETNNKECAKGRRPLCARECDISYSSRIELTSESWALYPTRM